MLKHNRPILNALLLAATFVVLAWYPNAVHGSACSTCQPPVRAKKWAWREAARITDPFMDASHADHVMSLSNEQASSRRNACEA